MSDPLVTCLCLTTAARRAWLSRAVECFRLQTYARKELLVVSEDDPLAFGLAPDIQLSRSPRGITLGAKHNVACELASGALIAKWDDDDWSAPGRLADQVARLEATGKALTGYSQMKFTDGSQWWRYVSEPNWPLGTSLVFHRSWWEQNRFPDRQVASDNAVIERALLQRQAAVVPAGDRMAATIHAGNLNNRSAYLGRADKYPLLAAHEAIPAVLASWPRAEALCCA